MTKTKFSSSVVEYANYSSVTDFGFNSTIQITLTTESLIILMCNINHTRCSMRTSISYLSVKPLGAGSPSLTPYLRDKK